MSRIFGGKSFAEKYVSKMGAARGANYLRASAVLVRYSFDGAIYLVVKTRPSAAGVKLILRAIKRGVAPFASIYALTKKVGIFAGSRILRAFVDYYSLFFWG